MDEAARVEALPLCASDELAEKGRAVLFDVLVYRQSARAFALRFDGRAVAYVNRCAHVPTEMDWQPGEFFDHSGLYLICATHGALYAPESGRCLGGRCNGKGLVAVAVTEDDGNIFFSEEGKASVG